MNYQCAHMHWQDFAVGFWFGVFPSLLVAVAWLSVPPEDR